MPRPKRSSEEVQRMAKAKADQDALMAKTQEEQILMIAQMETNDADVEDREEDGAVRCLADIEETEIVEKSDSADNLEADVRVDREDEDEDEAANVGRQKATKRKKKFVKGEARAAIDEAKTKIAQTKSAQTKTAGKKPLISKNPVAGLAPNWKARAALDDGSINLDSGTPLGGLTDADLEQEKPIHPKTKTTVRENDFICIRDTDSEGEVEVSTPTPKPKSRSTAKRPPTLVAKQPTVKPTPQRLNPTKSSTPAPRIKQEAIAPTPPSIQDDVAAAEVAKLPKFARGRWQSRFLPTLYAWFASSTEPFGLLSPDDKAGAERALQALVKLCYPDDNYTVGWNGPICTAACRLVNLLRVESKLSRIQARTRLSDRRSQIGKRALTLVQAYDKFRGKSVEEVSAFARYAVLSGPALWGLPAKQGVKSTSPAYVAPNNLFYSSFVIDTLAPFLKLTQGSVYEKKNPTGALALVAVAVERAFTAYYTGEYVAPTAQFSKEHMSNMVKDQLVNITSLTSRRWKEILALCAKANGIDPTVPQPNALMGSDERRAMYIPSSPTPESGDEEE
ncbi:hypothetical protein JAAARDRAFT_79714 [Jaapia argillacea MUCL 33604]|uniref:Uncharacterized protein n=1 Tax=Jaapia argillacea MUCL 33604 TaxID=933084 RepID=A0A067PLJ5_9AGAM|nr:hypothetical protein JAAARDRAFT_201262 [Jaapia argillacea MUCL 33604]KDQ55768.1 hypothetical protein JAAARDRAFT_79714 [Jaapia argillacea MUCL 33604]